MVIWTDIPIIIREKGRKMWADLPVARWNDITKRIEAVINPRGRAYALRKDDRFRKSRKNRSIEE